MPKPRGKPAKSKPAVTIKPGKKKLSALLELDRPDGGHNRKLLGMLTNSIRYERIGLADIDLDDLGKALEKLSASKSERMRARALALKVQLLRANNQLVLGAERVAQQEREAELRAAIRAGSNETPDADTPAIAPLVLVREARPVPRATG